MAGSSSEIAVWVDGRVVAGDDAVVPALDHGLLVGDGVFETLKVVRGVPFAWRRHLARLHTSAARLALAVPLDDAGLRAAADGVIAVAGLGGAPGRLRVTVTSGAGPLGSLRGEGPGRVVLAVQPMAPWEPATAVAVSPWTRNPGDPLAGAKSTSYAGNVAALAWAATRRPPAGEALFTVTGTGALSEGTGSNLFVAVAGRLHTPSLATACLAGVTRALVVELLEGAVAERDDLTVGELRAADEAFLTSSTRDVQPISVVDGHRLGAVPGPLTEAVAAAYAAVVERDLDP